MRTPFTVCVLALITLLAGCGKDAANASRASRTAASPSLPPARPLEANEVTVRIRKLGGADGKQLVNQIHVDTPIGNEFSVTEQVGITQLALRGKVILLQDGKYRVSYDYAETSPGNAKQIKSTWEMPPNTEEQVGGFQGEAGAESILMTVSRP